MPSDLLNSANGVIAMRVAIMDQIQRRMRRWFKRNTVIAFDDWLASGKTVFDFATVLGQLNVAHDDEILNLLDLLQQFEQSIITEDYNIWVDSVNGNDVTGIGTEDLPFQTLPRAQRLIPYEISSNVNIFLSGDFTEVIAEKRHIKVGGQLTFQSIDDATVIDAGPYTINTWTSIGTGAPFPIEGHKAKFVEMLDGAAIGSIFCISHNGASDLTVGYVTTPPAPGDTFRIIEPRTTITTPNFVWNIDINSDIYELGFGTQFIIAGCKINTALQAHSKFELLINLPFCYINNYITYSFDSNINDIAWYNNTQAVNPSWTQNNTNNTYVNYVVLYGVYSRVAKTTINTLLCYTPNNYIYRCSIEKLEQNQPPDCGIYIYTSYCHNDGTKPIFQTLNGCLRLTIYRLYVQQCSDIIDAKRCDISINTLQANVATVSGFTLHIGPNAQVSFIGALPSPAAGDITWYTTGATVAQPGIGASVTDTHGSFVYRIS